MTRGRPLGEVSAAFVRLAAESGPITAPLAAAALQLSVAEASRTAGYLVAAGHLVAVEPAQRPQASGRPARWLAVPQVELPACRELERWLHGS